MIKIGKTLISDDVLEKEFVCNLSACHGACCIDGDAGAPLNYNELEILNTIFPKIKNVLRPEGVKAIEELGTYTVNDFGEFETTLIDEKDCAYVIFDGKTALCGIEQAYNQGLIDFKKPISCHLYPIRLKEFNEFTAVNYDKWHICDDACVLGKELQVPVYQFLKEPLQRKFGKDWYDQLNDIKKTMSTKKQKFLFLKYIVIGLFFLVSCSKDETQVNVNEPTKKLLIKGFDASFLPTLRQSNIFLYNRNNQIEEPLLTLKNNGVNTIRLRIWNNNNDANSSIAKVKSLVQEVKALGMKTLISIHYSDTWADPGTQTKPLAWQNSNFETLKSQVYEFTKEIMNQINPDYIQIGNEINSGLLWQEGHISNMNQMKQLIQQGIKAVRDTNSTTKIILHFAGIENSNWFFAQVNSLNYDIIGISYYPIWHGKDLNILAQSLKELGQNHQKEILIAETSYPFTLLWNDWTNNIIGYNNQILPQYPATPQGQKDFLQKIASLMLENPRGIGYCYWGGEWVSFNGNQATNGSSYENQAFWDFQNKALPVLEVFWN